MVKLAKSTPSKNKPNGGVRISSTSDWTTLVNAVPIIIPIAKSNTLPRKVNLFQTKSR